VYIPKYYERIINDMKKNYIEKFIIKNSNGTDNLSIFNEYMLVEGIAEKTRGLHLNNLNSIRNTVPDLDLKHLTEQELKTLLSLLVRKYPNKATGNTVRMTLRKWLICSGQDQLVEHVKTIKGKVNEKLPDDMITKQELEAMLKSCSHPRDAAIIALLYDSGCRIGELLSMRVRDVEFDEQGAIVTFPRGKTGWRKNRVVFAASYLRIWLGVHEYTEDRDGPLFYSRNGHYLDDTLDAIHRAQPGNKEKNALSADGIRRNLKIIATKAGIKRRIHPHLFRHSRATELANHMTEQQLKKQLGWTAGSVMAAKYVHLTDKDTERAILKASGVHVEEEDNITREALKCSRCKEINAPMAEFCYKCGLPLSAEALAKIEADRQREAQDKDDLKAALEAFKKEKAELEALKADIRAMTYRTNEAGEIESITGLDNWANARVSRDPKKTLEDMVTLEATKNQIAEKKKSKRA
jgi:integrase